MKKRILFWLAVRKKQILILLIVLIMIISACAVSCVTDLYVGDIEITQTHDTLFNYHPDWKYQTLFVHNERLYWFSDTLYVLDNGWKKEVDTYKEMIEALDMEHRAFQYLDGFFYVVLGEYEDYTMSHIYCLNLTTGEYSLLISGEGYSYFSVDEGLKSVYAIAHNDTIVLQKGKIVGNTTKKHYTVSYNGKEYGLSGAHGHTLNIYENGKYTNTDLSAEDCFVYENELIIVPGWSNLLTIYQPETGTQIPLFTAAQCNRDTIDCSINMHGGYIYISYIQGYLDEWDFYKYFDDPELRGTYKINVRTRECQKLSDDFYEAMYIFDDSGIYAYQGTTLHKLSFNGELLENFGNMS